MSQLQGQAGAMGPQGPAGTSATITIGTVTSGTTPSVTNSGTPTAAVLNFVLPVTSGVSQQISAAVAPVFSLAGGPYTGTHTVTPTSATQGAVVHSTVDGSAPSCASPSTYPLSIAATTTVRSVACAAGFTVSAETAVTYTITSGGGGGSFNLAQVALGQNADFAGVQVFPNSWRNISSASVDTLRNANFHSVYDGNNLKWNFNSGEDLPYYVIDGTESDLQCYPTESRYRTQSQDHKVCLRPSMRTEGGRNPLTCYALDGPDYHLTVINKSTGYADELYDPRLCNGVILTESETLWDLSKPVVGQHPYGMTSGDVAGLPLFGMNARYDEVVTHGVVSHPLRFTLVKSSCAYNSNGPKGLIVAPASHPDNAGCGGQANATFGDLFRLRADFPVSSYPADVRPLLIAMQTYGLSFNDNGGNGYWQGVWDTRWNTSHLEMLNQVLFSDLQLVTPVYKFTADLSPEDDTQGVSVVRDQTAITANAASNDSTKGPLVTNNPPPPTITSFTADKTSVALGGTVNFSAAYTNGSMAYIDNAGVILGGATSDTPDDTTTYRLRVQGANGYITSDPITVTVVAERVATPTLSPAPGPFSSAQPVTIAEATPGAAIYYTTDGSTPGQNSTLYAGTPIPVSSIKTISARAFKAGMLKSNVGTGTYNVVISGSTPQIVGATPVSSFDGSPRSVTANFTAGSSAVLSLFWTGTNTPPTVACASKPATLVTSAVSNDAHYAGLYFIQAVDAGSQQCTASGAGASEIVSATEVSGTSGVDAYSSGNTAAYPKLNCGTLTTTGTNRLAFVFGNVLYASTTFTSDYNQIFSGYGSGLGTIGIPTASSNQLFVNSNYDTDPVCVTLALKP